MGFQNQFTLQFPTIYSASTLTFFWFWMVQKRLQGDQKDDVGSEIPHHVPKRRFTFANVVQQVMREHSIEKFGTMLEPLFRKVVREEVERAFLPRHPSPSSSTNQFELPQARSWQLHIEDKLPSTLFTGNNIESENGTPVKIVLRDAISKKTIISGSPSSLKVEIGALDGDFVVDDWTEKDYSAKIVRAREGKRPLLAGNIIFTLTNGVGFATDVFFTDNSSWLRSGKFRLGVRSAQEVPTEVRIREARSDAFVIKDQRGEAYKKHYPPNLGDEVWRLKKISKDGVIHRRLSEQGIVTVKDMLQLYNAEPSSLRNALGRTISNKAWEAIIKHANTCVLDNKYSLYYSNGFGLVFNSVFKVVAVTFDALTPVSLDKLDMLQMGWVEILKRRAHENRNDLILIDELSPLGSGMLQLGLLHEPSEYQQAQDAVRFHSYDFTNI